MPRKKKVKVEELSQTHAALNAPRSVSELLGIKDGYTAMNLEEYRTQIRAMTDIDLWDHARDVAGITPIANRSLLEDRLEKHFCATANKHLFQQVPVTMSPEAQKRQLNMTRL